MPLSKQDAQSIAAMGTQAPFGRGEETVVDPTVRKAAQLSPDQFALEDCNGTKWTPADAVNAAAATLAPGGQKLLAELHKLVVYQEGDFFKPHKVAHKYN